MTCTKRHPSSIPLCAWFLSSILFILTVFSQPAHSAGVTLAWDANREAAVAGYKVGYGTASGSYSSTVDVGNWTSVNITGLDTGRTYYFACKAYDSTGRESAYSNEVSYTPPAAACTYTISPAGQSFGSSGGTGSVTVTTQAGCAWSASSGASWLTLTSGSSGSGPGAVGYAVAANTAAASRSASLTIAGSAFTVSQQAASSSVTITAAAGTGGSISPSGTVTVPAGSSKTFTMTPRWFYKIYDVKVNGVSVGAVKSYTFPAVKSNQTISVTFKRK